MRIAVCDKDVSFLQHLESLLWQIPAVGTASIVFFSDPNWLLSDVQAHEDAFDILIVNKMFGNQSGITLAGQILAVNPWCRVIFLSDDSCILPDYFTVRHVFILPKEQVSLFLRRAVEKAIDERSRDRADFLTVTARYTRLVVSVGETLYLERVLRKTRIILFHGSVETSATPQQILGDRIGRDFLRCHRSFFLNMSMVRGFQPDCFLMNNGEKIPIGQTFQPQAKAAFDRLVTTLMAGETVSCAAQCAKKGDMIENATDELNPKSNTKLGQGLC